MADIDLFGFGRLRGAAIGPDIEANDDGVRC